VIRAKCQQAVLVLIGLSLLAWTGLAAAAPTSFQVPLSGAEQVPSVKTAGTGTADLTWDPSTRVVTWRVTYRDMSSPVTMAHFHHGARGRNGPVVIWLFSTGKTMNLLHCIFGRSFKNVQDSGQQKPAAAANGTQVHSSIPA
jgi:CHRD domain